MIEVFIGNTFWNIGTADIIIPNLQEGQECCYICVCVVIGYVCVCVCMCVWVGGCVCVCV